MESKRKKKEIGIESFFRPSKGNLSTDDSDRLCESNATSIRTQTTDTNVGRSSETETMATKPDDSPPFGKQQRS